MSAWYIDGTRGSGIVSSAAEVLWMSGVNRMRGVGGMCAMCMCLARVERGEWMRRLGLGFTNPAETWKVLDVCVFWLWWCGWCMWGWGRVLGPGSCGVGGCYFYVSLVSLCRWQDQVSVYCAWWIPAHLRCIKYSIMLHLMDICFLTCISL